MNRFVIFILYLSTGILILLSGCNRDKDPTIEELREMEIERRINQFVTAHKEECYENTLELAIHKADSLLKMNAVRYREDDLERPPLPEKPPRNLKSPPKDTIRNIPFLRKEDQLRLFGPDTTAPMND